MHILHVHLQNYRVHRDFEATIDEAITLLQGPNESGKSTFVEAVHRTLFLKAKGTSELHTAMSSNHGGVPTVTVKFAIGETTYTVKKEFNGTKGSTVLQSENNATLTGDAAEEKLAELLGVEGTVGGGGAKKTLPKRWAHLWVWQGSSNLSPLDSAEEAQPALRANLQHQAGAGLIVSSTDQAVLNALQKLRDETLTTAGKAKSGSELKRLEDALEISTKDLTEKQEILAELDQAAVQFTQANENLLRQSEYEKTATTELQETTTKLKEVQSLKALLDDKKRVRVAAAKALEELQNADGGIRKREKELTEKRLTAKPREQELAKLVKEIDETSAAHAKSLSSRETLTKTARATRALRDVLEAQIAIIETTEQLEANAKQLKSAAELKHKIADTRKAFTAVERFTPQAVECLRKLEQSATIAATKLEGFALRVELIDSPHEVTLDGRPLGKGSNETLTASGELVVDGTTKVRLTPGNTQDLESAKHAAIEAVELRDSALSELGEKSLNDVDQGQLRRSKAEAELTRLSDQWQAINLPSIEARREQLQQTLARMEAKREQSVEGENVPSFSDDLDTANTQLQHATVDAKDAESQLLDATSEEKAMRERLETLRQRVENEKAQQQELVDLIKESESRLSFERERWGDEAQRSAKLIEAESSVSKATADETQQQSKLNELGPEQLAIDHERLGSGLKKVGKLLQETRDTLSSAKARLQASGTTDPHRDLAEAQAEHQRIVQRHAQVLHQSDARCLLLNRLKTSQASTTSALTKPLEDAASGYLELLFDPGAKAQLIWSDDGGSIVGMSVKRASQNSAQYRFDELSHGTREQVALALRLAMAEVLAADHDGKLPVILDDAFTHADRQRIQKLQSVLYRGASRGLQILLLTCHPENYTGLTSQEITLPSPQ